ncbi:hypothetical protein A2483_04515 [Candidatus Peregrinibacteria bacterium RIFOXYC2_FULL_33_13]|nr:MAG: hypothetical protein UR27_C0010G0072 [Candidatus Peregrinibacteria bacterium GW2011_GWA2_33_10]KKP41260.1 MAG: hypothetical protein UR30_C0001G0107 [Candidatus Peregrinibacteria bacterium GW2011_GWC2_33_13]OGJ49320.1 MAG: hypothetical protein A2229_01460 [Candidatus Peregrinibacteria bacterium RIFOXYA2_FULL_33_7]OGJ54301.1 MAG: hypothetical protein A2483_04515 [Candidatus Peregrinibacteria bacterium RIFOXYC2_FULL_33_13]
MTEENQNNQTQKQQQQQVQIKVPENLRSGVYSNAVSVNVNQNEVIIDMGYILPNISPTTIEVVSRINMNHRTAESFMRILQNALLDFRNKQAQLREKKQA